MKQVPLNVWLLTIAQALIMSVGSVVVFVGGIVGSSLAPVKTLSTLPIASMVIGTATFTVFVTMLMKKIGRKKSFLIIIIYSILISLLAAYAIQIKSFNLFCISAFLFGVTTSCVMQFRFAAMESVPENLIPKAASHVLLGGIVAAFIGPETALWGRDLFKDEFTGSFVLLAGLFFLGFITLLFFKNPVFKEELLIEKSRSIKEISKQYVFWVAILSASIGYAVMAFIMTATPVSMHVMDGHSLQDTKWVIQSHILAMYVPSIIAGWIIEKLGVTKMMVTGLLANLLCIAIAFTGHSFINYWISLILLGVGWNFLFIGGTTLLPKVYRPAERFKVQAVNDFVVFGAQAFASLSAGWIVFALGWELMLLINLPFITFLFVVIIFWVKRKKIALTV